MLIVKPIVEITLFTGVVVHITPVAQYTIGKLRERARELHPDLDLEKYTIPVEGGIPGATMLDENDKEYIIESRMLELERQAYVNEKVLLLSLDFPDGQEALIKHFGADLERLAKFIDVDVNDPWEAVLHNLILVDQDDRNTIYNIIAQQMPLTKGEIENGMQMFRPRVSTNSAKLLDDTPSRSPDEE